MKRTLIITAFLVLVMGFSSFPRQVNSQSYTFIIHIILCDTTYAEYAKVWINDEIYPVMFINGACTIILEDYHGSLHIRVTAPQNAAFDKYFNVYYDKVIHIILQGLMSHPRNLYVDPLSLKASWSPPQGIVLEEFFENVYFPPMEWNESSEGIGWFRTLNGSSSGWNIPYRNSYYACTNDSLTGNANNGSLDYLFTPFLSLVHDEHYKLRMINYFDGANGQKAHIEYRLFGKDEWDTLAHIEPHPYWNELEIDLSALSGPDSEPIRLAFHSDDNGGDGSGWAIDDIKVFTPDPYSPVLSYIVYIDDSLVGITEDTTFFLPMITWGEVHTASVRALYNCGLSAGAYHTFTSLYLLPPSCFYQPAPDDPTMVYCPPLDSTENVPGHFIGYNLYYEDEFIDFIDPEIPFVYESMPPGEYGLSAVYELSPYGFPDDYGESMKIYALFVFTNYYGFPLDFTEDWSSGNFDQNRWTVSDENWRISQNQGQPAPCAIFSRDPAQTDYTLSLTSFPLFADTLTSGEIFLDFDLMLNNLTPSGTELMRVEIWDWVNQIWNSVTTFSNENGDIPWETHHIDITEYSLGNAFRVQFRASGENSLNLSNWAVDNINVYHLYVGLEGKHGESSITIYPNPARSVVRVESPDVMEIISIYNAYGKLLKIYQADDYTYDIPVRGFPPGVYLVRGLAGNRMFKGKVVVQ